MDSVAVRDFRVNPGKVWRRLSKSGRMVVTSTGKPIALLTNIKGSTIEQELHIDALARGAAAVSKLREHAQKRGFSRLRDKEIFAEIKKSRKSR
jgi:antitoxin (DNA-binding transcriptional repressor) of toxin-antitoxin stability system